MSANNQQPVVPRAGLEKDDNIHDAERASISPSEEEMQNGVKNIEAISQTWNQWSLVLAYLG
jgi:hypothetical protein